MEATLPASTNMANETDIHQLQLQREIIIIASLIASLIAALSRSPSDRKCLDTFPWPCLDDGEREKTIAAATDLLRSAMAGNGQDRSILLSRIEVAIDDAHANNSENGNKALALASLMVWIADEFSYSEPMERLEPVIVY